MCVYIYTSTDMLDTKDSTDILRMGIGSIP